MCHGGCGALLHLENGRLVRVSGDPDSPLNRGRLCPKGAASLEQVYHPDRLTFPLRRAGARGGGQWERLSWEEAYGDIVQKLLAIRESDGPQAIALGTGTGRHHFHFVPRLANAIGTPNWCEPGTAQCFLPRINVSVMTFGDLPVCDYYGEVGPKCILVWGHNPLDSGPDGELGFRQLPTLRKARPDPRVEIHPETSARLGISSGDWVWIRTRRGAIQQRARLSDGIDARVVQVEHGWWFPEEAGPEHGVFRSNANILTDDEPPYDPAMGTYQLRALLCRVEKAEAPAA